MKQTVSIDPFNLLEKALFILQDGICIIEKDATISYINCSAQGILWKYLNRRPVSGNNFFDFIAPERLEIHKEFISRAFENDPSSFEVEQPEDIW